MTITWNFLCTFSLYQTKVLWTVSTLCQLLSILYFCHTMNWMPELLRMATYVSSEFWGKLEILEFWIDCLWWSAQIIVRWSWYWRIFRHWISKTQESSERIKANPSPPHCCELCLLHGFFSSAGTFAPQYEFKNMVVVTVHLLPVDKSAIMWHFCQEQACVVYNGGVCTRKVCVP
jgi:hypothetical protein